MIHDPNMEQSLSSMTQAIAVLTDIYKDIDITVYVRQMTPDQLMTLLSGMTHLTMYLLQNIAASDPDHDEQAILQHIVKILLETG